MQPVPFQKPLRWRYLAQFAVLFLALIFLLIFNGTNNDFVDWNTLRVSAALLTAAGLAWLWSPFMRGGGPARMHRANPLALPLLVWAAAYAVCAAASLDVRRSLTQMLVMGVSLFLFSLAADLTARGWPAELFTRALLAVGALVVLLGWAEAGQWYARWLQAFPGQWLPDLLYRPSSANILAMFFNLLILLSLARALTTSSIGERVLLAVLVLASGGLLFLTSSRGGWLGAAVGGVGLGLFSLYSGALNWRPAWRWLRAHRAVLAAGLLLALLLLAAAGWVLYRQTIHPTHAPVGTARSEYWPPALDAFRSSPLVGRGPFSYGNAFMRFNSIPPKVLYVHAHGTLFNLLAELGLLGAAAMAYLLFHVARALRRRLQQARGAELGVVLGAAAAVIAVAVHAFFDGFHADPVGLWALVIVLGAALGRVDAPAARLRPWWVLLLMGGLWLELWSVAPLYQGVAEANSNRWADAQKTLLAAAARDPYSVVAHQQLALASSIQGGADGLALAAAELEITTRLEPDWALNHLNLGAVYAAQGRLDEARCELTQALQRAPDCMLCLLNLGVVSEQEGDEAAARWSYEQVLDRQPEWQSAYFWRSTPLRARVQAGWSLRQPPVQYWTMAELQENVRQAPNMGAYVRLAQAEIAYGAGGLAGGHLRKAQFAFANTALDEVNLLWAQAELAARGGDREAAAAYGEQAVKRYLLQGPLGPGAFGRLYYAPLLFRRPAMAVELVPQVKMILLPDAWASRAARVARWQEELGQTEQAAQLRADVLRLAPDALGGQQP